MGVTKYDIPKNDYFYDPLGEVLCPRCPLEECIRLEGEYGGYAHPTRGGQNPAKIKRLATCAVYVAEQRGWGPEEAARRGEELGLLEPWGKR